MWIYNIEDYFVFFFVLEIEVNVLEVMGIWDICNIVFILMESFWVGMFVREICIRDG